MTTLAKNKNIPKLRFPGFFGEWEEKKLGNMLSVVVDNRGKTPPIEPSGIPLLEIGSLGNKFVDFSKIGKYVSEETYKNWFRKHLQKNDILFSTVGATALCSFYNDSKKAAVAQNIVGLRFCNDDPSFAYYLLTERKNNHKFKRIEMGAVQPSVKVSQMTKIKFLLPSFEEQQKVAEFLGSVDEWIENLRSQKENLKKYKKGMMRKIFSQEFRFKDEKGCEFPEWDEKRIGDMGKLYNGLAGKGGEDFGDGEPFVTYKQIFDKSEIDCQKFALVKIGANEKQNKAQFGDVFFTTSSETPLEVGFSSVLLDKKSSPYLNSFSFGFRPNSLEILDPYFAKFFFRGASFRKDVVRLAQGSTRYNISKIGFIKIKVKLPLISEQQKIAEFLTSLDNLIESKQRQITQAEQWKKGLMQGMFV